jgi:hypothetical protein
MKSAMPSQANICGQSARTAVKSASSAQPAPQAVKTCTAKAAVVAAVSFLPGAVGPIGEAYT